MSPCPDPEAWATDALTCSWPRKVTYAFPPTCLILQFLRRLKRLDDFRCLLVAPVSPQAKWTPVLISFPGIHHLPIPGIKRDVSSTTLGVSPPISAQPPATYVVPSWGSLRELGFSERVVDRIINARAASTNKQYKLKWDYFVSWSTSSGRDPLAASLPILTEFLVHVFNDRKVSVRTLKKL